MEKIFEESIRIKQEIVNDGSLGLLESIAIDLVKVIKSGNKIMLCGNGGSAADAQHLAAELLIR